MSFIKPDQIFVRAQLPEGQWVNADVLDLDEISFRIFVMSLFFDAGMVVGIKHEAMRGEPTALKVDGTKLDKYRNK